MEKIDLSYYPYFELEPDSITEVFINGQSRHYGHNVRACRLYVIEVFDQVDSDDLPF